MERIIKIGIYVAVLFFASIWISSVIKSCNNTSTDLSEVSTDIDNDGVDEFEENFFEDDLEDENIEYESDMGGGTVESPEEDVFDTDYTEIDEVVNNRTTTNTERSTPTKTYTSNQSGKYMVLAGSYLIKDNASSMIGKLGKIGYNNAEIVVFNMSQYHSVCAARLSDYNKAVQLSNELKRNGIDNYIHTKQ